MRKKDTQITGNIGLYWTCYNLSRRGWNAIPTARNARGIDIVAYNSDCSRMIGIQVKTLRKKANVPLGKSLDKIMGDIWVVVNSVEEDPETFILFPSEVEELASRFENKKKEVSHWLQAKDYCVESFHEAWERIDEFKGEGI